MKHAGERCFHHFDIGQPEKHPADDHAEHEIAPAKQIGKAGQKTSEEQLFLNKDEAVV